MLVRQHLKGQTMEHLVTRLVLNAEIHSWMKAQIITSAWIDEETNTVQSILTIDTGSCHIHNDLNADQAEQMIANLQQHIKNIKTCELELIAQTQKTAA